MGGTYSLKEGWQAVIEILEVSKTFKTRASAEEAEKVKYLTALNHINLSIPRGTFFGLIGPNGAGKTTLLSILITLLIPTEGSATVNGHDVIRESRKVRESIGVVLSGERALYWKLSAEENLRYFARLYHMPAKRARERIPEVLELVGLSDRSRDYVERFSSGMKKRLAIAKAILHEPPYLFLDEPTANIDPIGTEEIHLLLNDIRSSNGTTMFLTSNNLREVEVLCNDIAIINHGSIVARSSPEDLKSMVQPGQLYRVDFAQQAAAVEVRDRMSVCRWCQGTSLDGDPPQTLVVQIASASDFTDLMNFLGEYSSAVLSIARKEPTIEEAFRAFTRRAINPHKHGEQSGSVRA